MASRKIEVQIVGDSRSLERAFGRSSKSGEKFGRSLGASAVGVGKAIAVAGAAIGALGVISSKTFSTFETSLSKIQGLVGIGAKQIGEFEKAILKLGPATAKSPQELADALFFITSAGLRGKKALDALAVSAKASAAGLGDTTSVADAVTSAVNAYAKTNLTAGKATDVLTAAVREGKLEASSLAPVLGKVLPTASALGVSFDKVAGTLAVLSKTGTSAAEGAIQVNAVLTSLLNISPKVTKALSSVGLSQAKLRDVAKGPTGLIGVFRLLEKRFKGNLEGMRSVIPNVRAFRAVMNALAQSGVDVNKVLGSVTNSTGIAGRAFDVVSKDEAFKFHQALASLQVIGIRLGAIFAPVAKKVAEGGTAILTAISNVIEKVSEARTVKAKLNVIFTGAKDAASKATNVLKKAVGRIDFKEVFASASGIADGLQKKLEEVDFGFVGERIGNAIRLGVATAIPAAQDLATRLNKAIAAIDFSGLGRKLGPELAVAVLSAFATITDPAFWIKNWDLALAVAVNALTIAFPEALGGAKIASLFKGIGARLALRFSDALVEGLTALPRLVSRPLVALVSFIGAQIGRLVAFITTKFNALGKITRFTIRVLGIAAVIRAIVNLAKRIGSVMGGIASAIAKAFSFENLKKRALKAALAIIEPFTHIPKILGGGTFQRLQASWQVTLDNMSTKTSTTTRDIQSSIDGIHGKNVSVNIDVGSFPAGQGPSAAHVVVPTKKIVKEIRDTQTNLDVAATSAATSAKRAKSAFEKLIAALSLKGQEATLTKSLRDDLDVINQTIAAVRARIKAIGATNDLLSQIVDLKNQQRDLVQQINENKIAARQASQFEKLGLTASGETPTPGVGALAKRLKSVSALVKGSALDTTKTRSQLRRIGRVLSGQFGAVGQQVRAAILSMLNDITSALDNQGQAGPLTKTVKRGVDQLVEGLGLTPEQIKAIRQRGTKFTPATASANRSNTNAVGSSGRGVRIPGDRGPEEIHIYIDGEEVEKRVTRRQQKKRSRRSPSRRGTTPGR